MKEELITFETAKLAKEKGFTIHIAYFNAAYSKDGDKISVFEINRMPNFHMKNSYPMVSQSILQRWLRETHNNHCEPKMYVDDGLYKFKYLIKSDSEYKIIILKEDNNFSSYEKALEVALVEALKLL